MFRSVTCTPVAPASSQSVPLNRTPVIQYAELPAILPITSAVKFQLWFVVYDTLHVVTLLACIPEVPGSKLG